MGKTCLYTNTKKPSIAWPCNTGRKKNFNVYIIVTQKKGQAGPLKQMTVLVT